MPIQMTTRAEASALASAKPKRPIEILRERHGGMSKELKDYFNEQQKTYKTLREALKKGPRTVPQLALECSLPSPDVMWHLMAMRRYGEVHDGPERNGYLLYTLKGA
jgi:hypothetical protein